MSPLSESANAKPLAVSILQILFVSPVSMKCLKNIIHYTKWASKMVFSSWNSMWKNLLIMRYLCGHKFDLVIVWHIEENTLQNNLALSVCNTMLVMNGGPWCLICTRAASKREKIQNKPRWLLSEMIWSRFIVYFVGLWTIVLFSNVWFGTS